MTDLEHEEILVRTGPRSGLPVIVAIHSTALGQAVGGCRVRCYPGWRDGLEDALHLSAGMTRKCAVAGLANGGGKTVVAVPERDMLGRARRIDVLRDVGDVIASLDGRYATGPDVGTTPADMAVIAERTRHVFCRRHRSWAAAVIPRRIPPRVSSPRCGRCARGCTAHRTFAAAGWRSPVSATSAPTSPASSSQPEPIFWPVTSTP